MKIKRFITIVLITVLGLHKTYAHGDIKFHLQLAMQMGDARGVAATMEDEPEITVEYLDTKKESKTKEGVQAMMEKFFAENKPDSFNITHNGQFQNGVRHMTGTFINTKGEKFEIYFEAIYDEVEAHHHLSHIRIEKLEG